MHCRNAARQRWVIDCAVVLKALNESNLLMPTSRIMRDFCKSATLQCSLSLENMCNCQLLLFQTVQITIMFQTEETFFITALFLSSKERYNQVLYLELESGNLFFAIPSVSCVCVFRTGSWNQDIWSKSNMPFRRLQNLFDDEEHLLSCGYDGIHACMYTCYSPMYLWRPKGCVLKEHERRYCMRRQSCLLTLAKIRKEQKANGSQVACQKASPAAICTCASHTVQSYRTIVLRSEKCPKNTQCPRLLSSPNKEFSIIFNVCSFSENFSRTQMSFEPCVITRFPAHPASRKVHRSQTESNFSTYRSLKKVQKGTKRYNQPTQYFNFYFERSMVLSS
jgi:hypothetical protein